MNQNSLLARLKLFAELEVGTILQLKRAGIINRKLYLYKRAAVQANATARIWLGSGYINSNLDLSCFERIEIGQDVAISEGVTIRDSDDHKIAGSSHPHTKPIKIGNRVWVGLNVTILKGVTIGDGVVIAAGALVTKDVPARCLAAGVPARIIRENVDWEL